MSIYDGGQAFPTHPILYGSADQHLAQGMSLRDWFAGQALAGIMANPERWRDIARRYDQGKMSYDDASKSNAVKAYSVADAMLAARNSTQPKGT